MQNEKRDMKANDPRHPALTPVYRWMANMICLWGLCAKPACRRARACRRDPQDCLARYAPLVPEEAREGVKVLLEGRQYGLSYDDVRADAPEEVAAVENWIARVNASRRNGAARRLAQSAPAAYFTSGTKPTTEQPFCPPLVAQILKI